MPTAWFRRSRVMMMALLGGLLMVLSGCHLHHYGLHGFYRGGHHGGGYYDRGGHRGGHYHGNRHRRHHGHRRGGWRGRY